MVEYRESLNGQDCPLDKQIRNSTEMRTQNLNVCERSNKTHRSLPEMSECESLIPALPVDLCELVCSYLDRGRDGWWVQSISKQWCAWVSREPVAATNSKHIFSTIDRLGAVLAGQYGPQPKNIITRTIEPGIAANTFSHSAHWCAIQVGTLEVIDFIFPVHSTKAQQMANRLAAIAGRTDVLRRNNAYADDIHEVITTIQKYRAELQHKRRPAMDGSLGLLVYGMIDPIACGQDHKMLRWLLNWVVAHGIHVYQLVESALDMLPYALNSQGKDAVAYLWAIADYIPDWSQVAYGSNTREGHAYGSNTREGQLGYVLRLLMLGENCLDVWLFCKEFVAAKMQLYTFGELIHELYCNFPTAREAVSKIRDTLFKLDSDEVVQWQLDQARNSRGWLYDAVFVFGGDIRSYDKTRYTVYTSTWPIHSMVRLGSTECAPGNRMLCQRA